ncbi:RNA-binding protein 44 isoform X1 [Trachypithecus francoisi]|uniref:RNA-binding protein 44 isoform X1 n=2 Tax=Trachypithecus francoisi TaxID=54180 RepID=UPI00141BAAB9|nr:RNA-binding protein 44 isoform X1 [Trachypithecus francoisi]XP_033085598.1 RNA-binding protein 44 isoform X1 [Trachypithecus francoisi]
MQATAVVETASGKGYHSNGGNLQKDKPSNPKKENLLLSSSGCDKVKLTFPDDDWDSSTLEQRANNKEINNIDKMDLLEPVFSVSQDTNTESTHFQSSELEDSTDYAFLNETYSIHYPESKLKKESLIPLSSELDLEVQKKEEVFFDILEHQDKTAGLERIYNISDANYRESAEDTQKHDTDEDSQQEYHSAEEQEYISNHLSFDQTKTLGISNPEVVELGNLGYEVKCASNVEDNRVNSESGSIISSDSFDVYGQEESLHVSKFQNSVMLREYHDLKQEKCKEKETSSVYHTVFDGSVLRSNSPGNQESQSKSGSLSLQKVLKTKIYTEHMKSQINESKDFCGNKIAENKLLLHLENPSTLPQDKALATLPQPCKDCQTSWTSVFDDSIISACGYSHYESLQNTPDSALDFSAILPKIAVRDNQAVEDNTCLKVAHSSTTKKTCFHNMEGICTNSMTDAASCTVTINQTVDVSTDFRACFTTSRATSARPSVVSTSSNTDITMMNKKRPDEWQNEKQKSVACSTDWSYSEDCIDTQMAVTKGSGKSPSVDSLKPNGNFLNKDFLELRKPCGITDLKKHPEREVQLFKDTEKDLPSMCCQKIMQRAIKAELHLLNVHYQMCRRHCCDIYKLVMENRNLSSNSAKKEVGSALLSLWGDLKVRYVTLKEKIHKGIPLEELPPLSVESKLLSTFSTFASRLMKKETHVVPFSFSEADAERDDQRAQDFDVSSNLKKTISQMSLSSDSSRATQHISPKKDDFKNGNINADFRQLKLDDKDCRHYQEMSEDWSDAKENLTGVDISGTQENQIEQDRWNLNLTLEMKNVESSQRDKGYLIHVGGLCPSVSEADLRSHFQKYQVSEISIYDSSTNYRYASLTFTKNSDAKIAVKEMNGIEINGKSVNVRPVKILGECTSPLSSKNGNRISSNNLEKSTNKEIHSAFSISRLPRTRPRQLGSEQDSEVFPSNQGVKKNCKQIESTKLLPDTPVQFIPPTTLNLRSFTKIIKKLAELHPEVSRDHIINALQEVRIRHKGFLNGLSINTIVEMTSSLLQNSASS